MEKVDGSMQSLKAAYRGQCASIRKTLWKVSIYCQFVFILADFYAL